MPRRTKVNAAILGILVSVLLGLLTSIFSIHYAKAQSSSQIELICPVSSDGAVMTPLLPVGQTFNNQSKLFRQWLCVDTLGNVNIQGVNGGTGPTTQSGGNCLSPSVLPGQVCAGPIPTPTGVNPSFEVAFANNSGTTSNTSTLPITGAPLTATATIALAAFSTSNGQVANAPDASWTLFDDAHTFNNFTIYRKALTSTSQFSISSNIGVATTAWNDFLIFLGGTYSSTPHTATATNPSCTGSQCASISIGPVTANNSIVVFGRNSSNSVEALSGATITDSLGDAWQRIDYTQTPLANPAGESVIAWIDQFASAGTHVLTIDSHQLLSIVGGCCKAYEINGTGSYYVGAAGPAAFRYLTPQDLTNAGIIPGILVFGQTTLGGNVTVTGSATNVMNVVIQPPASGCPCRADIRYSGWADFTGDTNEPDFDVWVSDGTTNMIPFVSGQSNASTGAKTAISASGISNKQYQNGGAAITFTLKAIVSSTNAGTIQFTFQAAQPTGGSGANAFLQVMLVPSN